MMCVLGVGVLLGSHFLVVGKLRKAEAELTELRREVGYLDETTSDQIAAIRVPTDEPLTYRVRVRVPASPPFRVAYSSSWPNHASHPDWYAAADLPVGESIITVRVLPDPRDGKWKITTIVRSPLGTKRVATVLPDSHAKVFRGMHDMIGSGVPVDTQIATTNESLPLIDQRFLVGEASLHLYGNHVPESDQIGIFAELQPDLLPLSTVQTESPES
jgi:hypothetical protein